MSIAKCENVTQDLKRKPIEIAQRMINFMTSASKSELRALKVDDRSTMIDLENKSIYKHK